MSAPPVRAREADRLRVVDALREAHVGGQLSFDEFEARSRAASSAVTLQELVPITSDLQGPPVITLPQRSGRTVAFTDKADLTPGRRLVRGVSGLAFLTGLAAAVMLLVKGVAAGAAAVGGGDAELHTPQGYADFVADLEGELGTTEVARAVVYADYVVVTVPVEGQPRRLDSYYYDGSFDEPSPAGTREGDEPLVDVAAVDGQLVQHLVTGSPEVLGVLDPTNRYVIVESWGDPPQVGLSVYASNDYESGYLVAGSDGRLLDAHPAAP